MLLQEVFQHLNGEDINYVLLRGYDKLDRPEKLDDVDLLVQADDLPRMQRLLEQHGFVQLSGWGYAPHHFFVTYDKASDHWHKLDVVTKIAFGRPVHALHTSLAGTCLANRRQRGQVFVLSPEDELATLLLHCVIDKQEITPDRQQRFRDLLHEVRNEHYLASLFDTYWSPTMSWDTIAAHIEAVNWSALLAERTAVIETLTRREPILTRVRDIRDRLLRKSYRAVRLLRPETPGVALLGSDGAGKSALAAGLEDSFSFPIQSIYMGLYQDEGARPSLARLPGISLALRVLTQWKRYLKARYYRGKDRFVIFDRYTYDALLSQNGASPGGLKKRLRRWLLANVCPAPDLAVLLDAPSDVLYARKGEHDVDFLEDQRRQYLQLVARVPEMVVVDATRDVQDVQREVTSLIWREYARRVGRTEEE